MNLSGCFHKAEKSGQAEKQKPFFKSCAAIFLCAFLLGGCSSDRHIQNLLITEGLGVDTSDGGVKVTAQSLNVTPSSSGETPEGNMTVNSETDGDSIASALSDMNKTLSKRLFFGQNKIIVIGKSLAESGSKSFIDYLLRSDNARADILVAVSEQDAEFILKSEENGASVPCENILNLVNNNEKTAQSIMVSANDLLNMYKDETSDIYLPVLSRKDDKSSVEAGKIAMFSDGCLSKILDEDETKGFSLLQGKAKSAEIELRDGKLGKINAEISDIKMKKHGSSSGAEFVLNAAMAGKITLSEIENGTDISLAEEDYKRITRLAETELEMLCAGAFDACKAARSDSLRLGEYIARDCPEFYETYRENKALSLNHSSLSCTVSLKLEKLSDNSRIAG